MQVAGLQRQVASKLRPRPFERRELCLKELGPFAAGSTPPVVAPADFLTYGYGSCTAWAKFLANALRSVGVPAREVGSSGGRGI